MKLSVNDAIAALVEYGISHDLIPEEERVYTVNLLLDVMGLTEYTEPDEIVRDASLEELLGTLMDAAYESGVMPDNGVATRDLFDTRLMSCLTPRPGQVIEKFRSLCAEEPKNATDWFYALSKNCGYVREYRIRKDIRWKYNSPYGELDITINLSKPEKDPKAIAAAREAKASGYPKCLLCMENEGYAGTLTHPARQNLRIIPLVLDGQEWGIQYSPYSYYNEHCIVLNRKHIPMKIDSGTFRRLLDFVEQFPHYFLGSNADLPIVGGSILSHDHFQGGRYTFAMEKAPVEIPVSFGGYEEITAGIVHWPLSVIRIAGKEKERLAELADRILTAWRDYTDEAAVIYARTDGVPHNTVTPIARVRDGLYELDLVLRNNLTTPEHPLGLYHPHAELHHIKKENIGLIEVMGLAVLPARLRTEMEALRACILAGKDPAEEPVLEKHARWAKEILSGRSVDAGNVDAVLKEEIGRVFTQVLEDAGVYKCTEEGRKAFLRFTDTLK